MDSFLETRIVARTTFIALLFAMFLAPARLSATTFAGRVVSVSASSFRFRSHWWDLDIHRNETTVVQCGRSSFALNLLRPGDYVEVSGKWDGERSVNASTIRVHLKHNECERRSHAQ